MNPSERVLREERERWIKKANYNLFNLKSNQVFIDLLTDSGTGAMSDRQWASMMLGDESYAGASSYYNLKQSIKNILGFDYFSTNASGDELLKMCFVLCLRYQKGMLYPEIHILIQPKGHIEFRKAYCYRLYNR